jgi:hypothetical protein
MSEAEEVTLIDKKSKVCTECHKQKPVKEFARSAYAKDGLMRHCRECHGAKIRIARALGKKKTKGKKARTAPEVIFPAPSPPAEVVATSEPTAGPEVALQKAVKSLMAVAGKHGVQAIAIDVAARSFAITATSMHEVG